MSSLSGSPRCSGPHPKTRLAAEWADCAEPPLRQH